MCFTRGINQREKKKVNEEKSTIPTSDDNEGENAEGSIAENLTLLVKKFKRFMKKKNPKGRTFQ